MDALTSLALGIAPELGRWLFGETAEAATQAVAQAVQRATGTADPAVAGAALAADPQAASQLRLRLAEIAADMAEKARKVELDGLAARLRDVTDARALAVVQRSTPEGGAGGGQSPMVWGAPVVSVSVLAAFGGSMALALLRTIPPGSEAVLNVLLGTLAAMATSVVNYWVGSSAGSARKEAQLELRR